MKEKKQATLFHALIPIVILVASLFIGIIYLGADPHILILIGAIAATLVAMFALNYSWTEIETGIVETIQMVMQGLLILMVVGTLIGSWILSGTVPAMIYYGLQILSPGIFLVATCIICIVVSLSTGSSWTTAGTVGIALMGVGQGLGIPPAMTAGAIISGAYFGDKMSPLSDTTNMTPAVAGATLFDHIKYMFQTTGPSIAIALILYGVLGARYAGQALDTTSIDMIIDVLKVEFNITPLLFIPPIVVIGLVATKKPALPSLVIGTIVGGLFAAIFQGAHIADIIDTVHYGFYIETGVDVVDSLLVRGGLDSMMWTISLVICAMVFGGVMEKTGMLQAVGHSILKMAKSTGSLVFATTFTALMANILTADQYLALVVPARMYKSEFDERGLEPKLLSRTLEEGGTLTSALIPWNTCGAYMMTVLMVNPLAYLPYAFFNLINPVMGILFAYMGWGIKQVDPKEQKAS